MKQSTSSSQQAYLCAPDAEHEELTFIMSQKRRVRVTGGCGGQREVLKPAG